MSTIRGQGPWAREYDLPPRWDGLPVEWGPWWDSAAMVVCPPPRHPPRCDRCGSTRPRLISTGRVWTDPTTAPPAIGKARLRGGRHLVVLMSAIRCPDCRHDTVLETSGREWDLDETDYTHDGSYDVTTSEG